MQNFYLYPSLKITIKKINLKKKFGIQNIVLMDKENTLIQDIWILN